MNENKPNILEMPGGVSRNVSIYFGHENWSIVLNMMIGIRKAILSLHPLNNTIKITDNFFKEKSYFELQTRKIQGNNNFRKSIKFNDYAPVIFERIRHMYGITNEMYQRSIGPETLLGSLVMGNLSNLTEQCSRGKSNSFFYYTQDSKRVPPPSPTLQLHCLASQQPAIWTLGPPPSADAPRQQTPSFLVRVPLSLSLSRSAHLSLSPPPHASFFPRHA